MYNQLHVLGFLDSKLAGSDFYGYPVFHPDILNQCRPEDIYIFICTTNQKVYSEIKKICDERMISNSLLDAAILKLLKQEFLRTTELLDLDSRTIYEELLANRAEANTPDDSLFAGESYFGLPSFCRCNPNDIIVDCGAYVGDSAERYIWRMEQLKKYIAIEPDKGNFHALQRRFARLREEWNFSEDKLIALNGGVDETTHKMYLETRVDGLGSIACKDSDLENGIPFWAIDDLFPNGYTFLKADIESYEYRMICGAKNSIKKYRPRIAVCIYHNMIDMYSIPQLIHSIDPSYCLSVRHHSYGYEETVLYAY